VTDLNLYSLAEQVLRANPKATKYEWGVELRQLVQFHDDRSVNAEVEEKTLTVLGQYVAGIKTNIEKQAQAERHIDRAVSYSGRLMTPTLSVRTDLGSQTMLWTEASPQQFMEAVLREQAIIDGRRDSNRVRLSVFEMLKEDDQLSELPTLGDVCKQLHIDPDTLGLDELGELGEL
jgi:hypothetical protein